MPELPDIVVYIEALEQRILAETLERVQIASPFLLRTAVPPIRSAEGCKVVQLRRMGKRICIGLEGDLWLVLHLMIAGRLHWRGRTKVSPASAKGRVSRNKPGGLAIFEFPNGTLSLTEAGTQRRASLHLVTGEHLQRLDPGGLEIFETDLENFARVLTSANHTLKRALTNPRLFSGIGNAYSDEILFDARLSPIALTQKLTSAQIEQLFNSTRATLMKWIEILRTPSPGRQKESSALLCDRVECRAPGKPHPFRPRQFLNGFRNDRVLYRVEEASSCGNYWEIWLSDFGILVSTELGLIGFRGALTQLDGLGNPERLAGKANKISRQRSSQNSPPPVS